MCETLQLASTLENKAGSQKNGISWRAALLDHDYSLADGLIAGTGLNTYAAPSEWKVAARDWKIVWCSNGNGAEGSRRHAGCAAMVSTASS
jgi:hypothetical protein